MNRLFLAGVLAAAGLLGSARAEPAPRILPGLQPDGSTLLHNQWPIRPVGRQVAMGDFPVMIAVDPSGRYAAVLNAGYSRHEVRVVDLDSGKPTAVEPIHEAFRGLAFSADGRRLFCSGAGAGTLQEFSFAAGRLTPLPGLRLAQPDRIGVIAGFAFSRRDRTVYAARLFDNQVLGVDPATGASAWATQLDGGRDLRAYGFDPGATDPGELARSHSALVSGAEPLDVAVDPRHGRLYVSLWGKSSVAVLDSANGRVLASWPCGLHPNELLLGGDGRLYVSNSGLNTVTVLSTEDGGTLETLSTAMIPGDLPGATPNSLALTHDGRTLFVANAYDNNIAVFDVGIAGQGRPIGFIPTGWFPSCVRLTPDDRTLLVASARGLAPHADSTGSAAVWPGIARLYRGSLGIIALPGPAGLEAALAPWTRAAESCRPAPAAETAAEAGNPIPARAGEPSPIRYVIYIIKENRTYDQVLGDMPEGNGDPRICLFPEKVTPNIHAIARQFVLLDNFYVNAEVSSSGHEWSMAGYSSDFVEKNWPPDYGHRSKNFIYPGEGTHEAAFPALGYIWDGAARAGVSYRSYGEFAILDQDPPEPVRSNLPALKGHMDPGYRGWNLDYHDVDRAARFISELHRFEREGGMPRLQIVRLPQDHTSGAKTGKWTPAAMVADNDLALGRVVEAVSHSRFWPHTAIFVLEDDAQSGPDHVDAHRSEALVISPYVRRGAVDSTPYTTCSMLRSMELILGLAPLSQFDAAARPLWASFQAKADPGPFTARPAGVDIEARNAGKSRAQRISATLDFSHEDANDDQTFNRVIWEAVRGEGDPMPAPVHAAYVRSLARRDSDGDDDGD